MFLFPLNSYGEALSLSVVVFGDGAFGMYLGLGEVVRVGTSWWDCALLKGDMRELSLSFSLHVSTERRCLSTNQEGNP